VCIYMCIYIYIYIYIYIGNKSFGRVERFNHLGTSLMNQDSFHEEIKCRLQSGNNCYFLVQNLSSSSLLSKHIRVQIYGTIISLLFCMGVILGFPQ